MKLAFLQAVKSLESLHSLPPLLVFSPTKNSLSQIIKKSRIPEGRWSKDTTTALDEHQQGRELGQEIKPEQASNGVMHIYQYSDGSSRKQAVYEE